MAQHIENIVIGNPIVESEVIFASSHDDWINNESKITVHTSERFLPKILVDIGFTPSTSEIRRNRKDLIRTLDKLEFIEIKIGKKKCWILVGE
jgi:hypothetical protein